MIQFGYAIKKYFQRYLILNLYYFNETNMSIPLTNSNKLSEAFLKTDEKHRQFEKYAHASFITIEKQLYSDENPTLNKNLVAAAIRKLCAESHNSNKVTADPAPLVYNDTVFLYTSHDEDNSPPGMGRFLIRDWLCYTSTDMSVNAKKLSH